MGVIGRSMLSPLMQINSPILLEANPQPAPDFGLFEHDAPDAKPHSTTKVLLVDDSEMTLARAKSVLSARCVVVGTATNGHAALEAAATLKPDIVVLDISMPGMNGFEVATHLRAAGSTAQLVFLTVHEEQELILAARSAGAIGYVTKARLASDLELAVREARAGRPFQSPAS